MESNKFLGQFWNRCFLNYNNSGYDPYWKDVLDGIDHVRMHLVDLYGKSITDEINYLRDETEVMEQWKL